MKSAPWPPLMLVNGAFGSFGLTRTKARTRKVSSSSSPKRKSSASVAVDGEAVVAGAAEQRRVLARCRWTGSRAWSAWSRRSPSGARPLFGFEPSRADWKTWPTWNVSSPASPKIVVGARLSSSTKVSSPSRPKICDAAVDLAVVVDALDEAARHRRRRFASTSNAATDAALVRSHVRAQQEEVGAVGAEDPQLVDAEVERRRGVVDDDPRQRAGRRRAAGEADLVEVAVVLAAQREQRRRCRSRTSGRRLPS